MNRAKNFSTLTLLLTFLFTSNSCQIRDKSSPIIYLIPEKFEGAVAIFYDQKDGVKPNITDEGYIFIVPSDGVLKVETDAKIVSRIPKFFLIDENGKRTEIELLYHWGPKYPEGMRSVKDISDEESNNKIFAILYEHGNFNTSNGIVRFKSFLVGKPKDTNLLHTQKVERIAGVLRTFPK